MGEVFQIPVTRRFALLELIEVDDPSYGKHYKIKTNLSYRMGQADYDRAMSMLGAFVNGCALNPPAIYPLNNPWLE